MRELVEQVRNLAAEAASKGHSALAADLSGVADGVVWSPAPDLIVQGGGGAEGEGGAA